MTFGRSSRRRYHAAPAERGQTPSGFRAQLLRRLRDRALRERTPVLRLQRWTAFDRLLTRLSDDGTFVVKGGFALQFRYGLQARSTRDVDLRARDPIDEAVHILRQAIAASPIQDFFSFELGQVDQEMAGAPGGGRRVVVVARVGGEEFVHFHVDISSGDALVDAPDILLGSDLLQDVGIARIRYPVYPVTQHLAEKLHSLTLPRSSENTRVTDLVDLVTFAITEHVDVDHLSDSVAATFKTRGSHPVPPRVPDLPERWSAPFSGIAASVNLPIKDIREGQELVERFWNPFLSRDVTRAVWSPLDRQWHAKPP